MSSDFSDRDLLYGNPTKLAFSRLCVPEKREKVLKSFAVFCSEAANCRSILSIVAPWSLRVNYTELIGALEIIHATKELADFHALVDFLSSRLFRFL